MSRKSILDEIRRLDPVKDNQRIAYLISCYEFPFDNVRALEFALYRTYAVPSIGGLLDQTGEFAKRVRKRYDDTDIIMSEISINGYDSERGRAALRRMNQQHGRYPISNDDMLYVLSTFIYEPLRWHTKYAYRPLIDNEKLGWFHFWREVGKRMNIQNIPTDYDEYDRWNREYEQTHYRYSDESRRVAESTRDLFLSWMLPKPLYGIGAPFVYALLDEPLLKAFGFPKNPKWMTAVADAGLRLRNRVSNWLPMRKEPFLRTSLKRPDSYPNGYTIEGLGADRS